ncbi:S8 family serine peptidase [Qipengyuania nanhaisediminis]|uniref:S8 family serine peptidase n=1 Tax=Qipengyuania nanhaisediminis TaxID=604088 RepID=UPI0038B2F04F
MRFNLPTFLAAFGLAVTGLTITGTLASAFAPPLAAQVQLSGPSGNIGMPPVSGVLGDVRDRVSGTLDSLDARALDEARSLLRARERFLDWLVRRNRDTIERDGAGNLARRGELVAIALGDSARLALSGAGFTILSSERIEGLDIAVTRLAVPEGLELGEAQALASALVPNVEIAPDSLHFQAGVPAAASAAVQMAAQGAAANGTVVGMIDGAPGAAVPVEVERGFAAGAPMPSDHGTAVASLLRGEGVSRIKVADVYGRDPAGGNALAIARALGWLASSGADVITISLVGPRNALVERAVGAVRARGIVVVAAVGNDGPAAPPAFPASYDGVVAVTGADRRGRALIEAGRALHLDYAAPGERVFALDRRGTLKSWRGTSFATPLVAARIAAAMGRGGNWRARLDAEARDLGARGPDPVFGRGLVCEPCARKR